MSRWRYIFIFVSLINGYHLSIAVAETVNTPKKRKEKPEEYIGKEHISDMELKLFDNKYKKNLWGMHNTAYLTPYDVKYNTGHWNDFEILNVRDYDLYTYKQRHGYKIQDLGNEGTAVKYLYPKISRNIGHRSGYDSFNIYFQDPLYRRYYDTHGPLTDATVVFANYGSFVFDFIHSHSFNPNWHVAVSTQSMLTDREYFSASSSLLNDRQVITYPLALSLLYINDEETYTAFLSFYRKKHRVHETGGISYNISLVNKKEERNLKKLLGSSTGASNNIFANDYVFTNHFIQEYFIYHEYIFNDFFQVYNELYWINEWNKFKIHCIPKLPNDKSNDPYGASIRTYRYLTGFVYDYDTIVSRHPFGDKDLLQAYYTEQGIKGEWGDLFYKIHYRLKGIDRKLIYIPDRKTPLQDDDEYSKNGKHWTEHFTGVTIEYRFNEDHKLAIDSDILLYKEMCFYVDGGYKGTFGNLTYTMSRYLPSLLSQKGPSQYKEFRQWNNNFENLFDQQILLEGDLSFSIFTIQPYTSYMIRKNPIFFVKNSEHNEVICASTLPKQYKETINTLHVGGLAGICLFDNYHFDVDIVKSIIGEETKKIINNVPEWNINARLYYMSDFYDHRASLVVGTALNWHTPYFGDGYDPVVQQFYSQNFFEQWSYPLWDIYLNFRINKFRAFLKVTNLLQYAYEECPHYFASPFYPGQGRTFDFGVSWSIFD